MLDQINSHLTRSHFEALSIRITQLQKFSSGVLVMFECDLTPRVAYVKFGTKNGAAYTEWDMIAK